MAQEVQLQGMRNQFLFAKSGNPEDLNEISYIWELAYATYRKTTDAETAYSWLVLLLEVSRYLIETRGFINDEISSMSLRSNYAERFSSEVHPELSQDVIEWAENVLCRFDIKIIKPENENWRTLPHNRIRELGRLRNVLAFIRRHPSLRYELQTPNLDEWMDLSKRLLR